jgi:cell surface protein SprA
MQTSFIGDDRTNNNSPLFDNYIQLRNEISQRLSGENSAGDYERNAQDVLIPAFVSAYTGRGGRGATFPRIPAPNWKITYNGLAKMDAFKDKFRSFNITHGYQAEYNTGGYTSSLLYDAFYLGLDVGLNETPLPTVDPENGRIVPVYIFNQITISENFSPLIGIDMRTKSDVSFKINYNRKRDIMLNLNNAQVTELKSNDISIDVGFRKKDVKVPFTDYILKNDLTFRTAFTIRSTKTVQRSIDDEEYQKSTVTAGNFNLQFKPTLAYMISKRLNLTAYFERGINSPLVSNSFRRTNTAFGIQLRFSLAQ